MLDGRATKALYALCAVAFVVIVVRAYLNVKTPDDFVVTVSQSDIQRYVQTQLANLQKRSFEDNLEYCTVVFEDSEGELGHTPLREGSEASCDIAYFDEPGMGPVASFHTHGAYSLEYDGEVPSVTDIESDISERIDGYIATPGGRLWHIDWRKEHAIMVCAEGCLEQDPGYQTCVGRTPKPEYTIETLKQRATDPTGC